MAAPQTGFEATGEWTPLLDEAAFWEQVATDTDLTLTVAGMSEQGRPVYRVDLGTGTDQTMMITSVIHANEPATRDALMAFMRDLAYSTDPDTLAYLTTHRIVALVPCNPDRFPTSREQSQGININRDFYTLGAAETRLIMDVTATVAPHMILDIHEYHGQPTSPDWMYRAGGNLITPAPIRALEQSCAQYGNTTMQGLGYTTQQYWGYLTMRAGRSTLAGPMNTVGVLSETNTAHAPGERVLIQYRILNLFQEWHAQNAAACTDARAQGKALAATTNNPVPLYTHEYLGTDTNPEIIDALGYQLAEPIPATHDVFGIAVAPDGFVPMQQEAQWVIPTLLDPASPDAVAAATRVPHPDAPPPTSSAKVRLDGLTYEVAGVRLDGQTYALAGVRT